MVKRLFTFLLWSLIIQRCLILLPQIYAVPVRIVVDVKDEATKDSPSQDGLRYSPTLPQRNYMGQKTVRGPSRIRQKRKARTYEEILKINRDRMRKYRKEKPEYLRDLNHRAHIRRQSDPEKKAKHDAYLKEYRERHKDRLKLQHKVYMQKYRSTKKATEQDEKIDLRPNKRRRLKGSDQQGSFTTSSSSIESKDTEQNSTIPRPHIVARLKLPAKTIEKFYGPQPSIP
ncbi:uncharacterized protein FA14DRAFT_183931 [Meira miltonrushii]|uniref:Uncharacterized protein n=1 Tax=Meira miltonrushii TaxID=1280837 RepID=A0A316VMQ2_9BASI|nr:uncharacterized protein FA14DRAFT_183931 [Meira miltonrushii]PWN38574.1 hypothetical protein FA14DRAFT_183931 [Meira miltonrushii]